MAGGGWGKGRWGAIEPRIKKHILLRKVRMDMTAKMTRIVIMSSGIRGHFLLFFFYFLFLFLVTKNDYVRDKNSETAIYRRAPFGIHRNFFFFFLVASASNCLSGLSILVAVALLLVTEVVERGNN